MRSYELKVHALFLTRILSKNVYNNIITVTLKDLARQRREGKYSRSDCSCIMSIEVSPVKVHD